MATLSLLQHFYPFQKVDIYHPSMVICTDNFFSQQTPAEKAWVPEIHLTDLPCIFSQSLHPTQTVHDHNKSHLLSQWLFSVHRLWFGAIYCGLPWAGLAGRYHSRVVSQVSFLCLLTLFNDPDIRCDAMPHNLDDPNAQCRFHEKTDYVFKYFDPSILWEDYGIWCDVMVCILLLALIFTDTKCYSLTLMIFHMLISMSYSHPTSYINLPRVLSRTILSPG